VHQVSAQSPHNQPQGAQMSKQGNDEAFSVKLRRLIEEAEDAAVDSEAFGQSAIHALILEHIESHAYPNSSKYD
ncbi:hypothetical protein P7L97_23180, partial [Vibrio parahaemolyticus]|nr:hypothetical protein [Vibrio parahaemolyticus]